jgi:hypothetical protein
LTGDQPVAKPLPTHKITQKQNKRTQISMSPVGIERTISVLECTKTVHALDPAVTVIGGIVNRDHKFARTIPIRLFGEVLTRKDSRRLPESPPELLRCIPHGRTTSNQYDAFHLGRFAAVNGTTRSRALRRIYGTPCGVYISLHSCGV